METDTGWFVDPFEAHEARWFSAGRATDLISDHGIEGHDEPPEHDELPDLRPFVPAEPVGPDDLERADANTRVDQSVNPGDTARAAETAGEIGVA